MLSVSMKVFSSSILCVLMFFSCDSSKSVTEKKIATDNGHLVGKITLQNIIESEHKEWYVKELGSYNPDTETLDDFNNNPQRLKSLSVKIFMATWCEDSHRELPRFVNIMRYLNITDYEIIAMDYYKETPQNYEKGLDIKYVPTFIIYSNGKEMNRIIESPVESLEKDLISIVQANSYTPNYQD